MTNDSLGDRMKRYEDCYRAKLPKRVPKIIRIDGKAFHTYLKDARRPYDPSVAGSMMAAANIVMTEIGGTARMAYIQSDECSILLNDALDVNTEAWFDNNIQKIASVSASIFTAAFNDSYSVDVPFGEYSFALFDARVFILPDITEVCNYMIWRQQDATRNSIQQYGRHYFSHGDLLNKSCDEIQNMLMTKHEFNWNDAPTWTKRGMVAGKWVGHLNNDYEIPIFTQDREYITSKFYPPPEPTIV